MPSEFKIVAGDEYRYLADSPVGCKGQLYRAVRFVLDVPSYQQKVLVEALTGKDKGLWFTCSLANFAARYEPVKVETPAPDKGEAGYKYREGDKMSGLIP